MNQSFLLLSLTTIIGVAACNNKPKQSSKAVNMNDTTKPVEIKIMIPVSSCYSSTIGKDTVYLKVEVFEHVVTGNLSYKFYEKDSNKGDFEGRLIGDTLIADYKFMSEGKQSIRQVVFLIQDSIAIEGYGNMEDKNGKMVFKNVNDVAFGKGLRLQNISCEQSGH